MRSVGDLVWLNDYIGIPYELGGRSWDGLDCYGLVKLVYREEFGIALPDWLTDKMDLSEKASTIENIVCSGAFRPTETPDDGDFAVCYRHRAAHHLGLYFGGGILHAQNGAGVIYEMRSHFERQFVRIKYGTWLPD